MFHTPENEQHIYYHNIYYHNDAATPSINVNAERNSKGWNFSATVVGAATPEKAMELLNETVAKLEQKYGTGAVTGA